MIDHIDYQISNKTSARVFIYFTPNPGFVNETVIYSVTEFVRNRPEWIGNVSSDSIEGYLFEGWLEETIRTNPALQLLYPYYLSIIQMDKQTSIYPISIPYWYPSLDQKLVIINTSEIPKGLEPYISSIEFERTNKTDGQVFVYFKHNHRRADWNVSMHITTFILERPEWIGDRSKLSITIEILFHWIAENSHSLCEGKPFLKNLYTIFIIGSFDNRTSPIEPIHLGYYYAGLNSTPIMDPFLKTI